MRLIKADVNNIKSYSSTKLDAVIAEFVAMDTELVKIEGWEESYKTPYSCMCSINNALKRRGETSYICKVRSRVPYIAKKGVL